MKPPAHVSYKDLLRCLHLKVERGEFEKEKAEYVFKLMHDLASLQDELKETNLEKND